MAINASILVPGLRFKGGESLILNITNAMDFGTSINWHGSILPYKKDGQKF